MRFIIEFELHPDVIDRTRSYRDYVSEKMNILEKRLGEQIAISFHWAVPEKMEAGNYKLEIEAFPMDKWVEFRKRFLAALPDYDNTSRIRLEHALHDLESFGKPSGDAITNQQTNTNNG